MALRAENYPETPHDHVVQFYGDDDDLAGGVGPYLAGAVAAGGVAIVIATETHRRTLAAWLAVAGIDVPRAREAGAIVMVDAAGAMDDLLMDGRLAPHRFDKVIGDLVRDAAAGGGPVRAYGEIVALMWDAGHVNAALELETLWNRLCRDVEFSLYCAYPLASVEGEGDVEAFHQVCRRHSAVVGTPVVLPRLEPPPLELARTFMWGGRGPAEARRFVIDTLTAWGHGGLVEDAAVIATELATNAVLHARTDFIVTIARRPDGTIRVAVRDHSVLPPRPRHPGLYEGSGRGLRLVEAIAGSWGTDLVAGGKVVWAQLDRTVSGA